MDPMSLIRYDAPYRQTSPLTYHRIDIARYCPLAEEVSDWEGMEGLYAARFHVLYVRTRYVIDYGSIREFLAERGARGEIVEQTVSDLTHVLSLPEYDMLAAAVVCEELFPQGNVRDIVSESFIRGIESTHPGRLFSRILEMIIIGGP